MIYVSIGFKVNGERHQRMKTIGLPIDTYDEIMEENMSITDSDNLIKEGIKSQLKYDTDSVSDIVVSSQVYNYKEICADQTQSATDEPILPVNKMKEYIMCSAIWVKDKNIIPIHVPRNIKYGSVYCSYRHCDCIELISHKYDRLEFIKIGNVQGFLTSEKRFVDRVEGMKIAKEFGQLLNPNNIRGEELYSEDLWLQNDIKEVK